MAASSSSAAVVLHGPAQERILLDAEVEVAARPEADRMYSVEQMRAALDRERARSDRTGQAFCVLSIAWSGSADRARMVNALVRLLHERLRRTDEFGWLDRERVGVLLLDTTLDAARHVARTIMADLPEDLPAPTWGVYTHGAGQRDPDGPDGPDGPRSGRPSKPNGAKRRSGEFPEAPGFGVWDPRDPPVDGAPPSVTRQSSACDLEPTSRLYARPLPRWKRAVDIVGASMGLALCSPILLAAVALVKMVSPGPAFFRQTRTGLGGVPFTIFKLRTMHVGAEMEKAALRTANELEGPVFKIARDPRVIPFGCFLRRTSIDELPQFWNVLRGDMSLVGPRPLDVHETAEFAAWQRERDDVTPGLTCTWQVSGRSRIRFAEWVRMDIRYARTPRSLTSDLKLILRTVPAVLFHKGAY